MSPQSCVYFMQQESQIYNVHNGSELFLVDNRQKKYPFITLESHSMPPLSSPNILLSIGIVLVALALVTVQLVERSKVCGRKSSKKGAKSSSTTKASSTAGSFTSEASTTIVLVTG